MTEVHEYPAPNGRHTVRLVYEFEIRFGPPFFRAVLDEQALDGAGPEPRVFGDLAAWSGDSRFLALQLWNSTQAATGPDTSLFVVRMADLRFFARPRVRGGWVRNVRFEGDRVAYDKDTSTRSGRIEEFEIDVTEVRDWQALFPRRGFLAWLRGAPGPDA